MRCELDGRLFECLCHCDSVFYNLELGREESGFCWLVSSCLYLLFFLLMAFFSSLDGRKEAKEDQGVRDASQFGRVHDESDRVPGNLRRRPQPPFFS